MKQLSIGLDDKAERHFEEFKKQHNVTDIEVMALALGLLLCNSPQIRFEVLRNGSLQMTIKDRGIPPVTVEFNSILERKEG